MSICAPDTVDTFATTVDELVAAAASGGIISFGNMLRALPGVYPLNVIESLRRLVATKRLPSSVLHVALAEASMPAAGGSDNHRSEALPLPHPHPLDFDWRFTDSAKQTVLAELSSRTAPGDTIALLATPSLVPLAARSLPGRRTVLLEHNAAAITRLRGFEALRCDVMSDALPDLAASAVVIDPPWYEEQMRSFLWAGAQLCQPGKHIYLSFPAMGTRPGITSEWTRLEEWARRLGLILVRVDHLGLSYDSPYFERNALRAAGIRNVPSDWRHADLAVFVVAEDVAVERPTTQSEAANWEEVTLGDARFKVRTQTSQAFTDPSLQPLVPGDVLPCVSRRNPLRNRVDVWTSGNRVYRCDGRATWLQIATSLAAGTTCREAVQSHIGRQLTPCDSGLVARVEEQLVRLADKESQEARSFTEV